MAAHVARLERVARRTLGCVRYEDSREGSFYDDERCWSWYERLERSGVAGVHAMGRALLAELARTADDDDLADGQRRLVSLLGASERVQAAPYLLEALASARGESARDRSLAVSAVGSLQRVTENDVAPTGPWQNPYEALESPEARSAALAQWRQWYAEHEGERRRQWRASGLEIAQARLRSADPTLRFAGVRRLADAGRSHFAIADSLREVLARPDLEARTRRAFARFATVHGLLRQEEVRSIVRGAASPRS